MEMWALVIPDLGLSDEFFAARFCVNSAHPIRYVSRIAPCFPEVFVSGESIEQFKCQRSCRKKRLLALMPETLCGE